jgi:hypothetical protein
MNIYDYAENQIEDERIDRGMKIKIEGKEDTYIIINQIRVNAYSMTYSAIKIKDSKSIKN